MEYTGQENIICSKGKIIAHLEKCLKICLRSLNKGETLEFVDTSIIL